MTTLNADMTNLSYHNERPGIRRTSGYVRVFSALLMIVMLSGGSALYAAAGESGPVHTNRKYWIGKNISQAEKEFGAPTFSEQLIETGGMLVIYAGKKDTVHFVFETNAGGVITKAARVE